MAALDTVQVHVDCCRFCSSNRTALVVTRILVTILISH